MKSVITEKVKQLIGNLLSDKRIELIEMTYRRESGGMVLRLLVDKEGGITLDDCTHLNERIGDILDSEDVIADKYTLEVSSPGLDRPLKTRRDFERLMGKEVHVHTYEPVEERRDHEGAIRYVDDEKVRINDVEIRLDKISRAKLKIDFK
jgi:ribosome maturation factor RimP